MWSPRFTLCLWRWVQKKKKVHGTWALWGKHPTDTCWVTTGHFDLSTRCTQRSGMRTLPRHFYGPLFSYALLGTSLKQQGFHTDRRECGWPSLVFVWHSTLRTPQERRSGICITDATQNTTHSWENISCIMEINIYFSSAGKHVPNKWYALFFF